VVLAANLMGAAGVALVAVRSSAFEPNVRAVFLAIGHESMSHGFGSTVLRAIFAGWLIALMVWMLPYAETARFFVILLITWVVGIGHFSHIIAGAVNVFGLAWAGEKSWLAVLTGFMIPR
jgi:formate/nitrite transporter FocA (FNT family)